MIYKTLASYYDALVTDENATSDWVDYTRKHVKDGLLLDLGCGSGDFAVAMAEQGYLVEASDLSAEMIKTAQSKKGSELVKWYVSDMLDLNENEKYDAITCYCDSINYLQSYRQLETVIENVYRALKVKGVFMFDIHSLDTLQQFKEEYIEEGYVDDVSYQWCIYSIDDNLFYSFIFQDEDGILRKELHQQLVFNPVTVKELLEKQGFKVELSTDFTVEGIAEGDKIFFSAVKK
jgi:ubiquinone/menaquinone biosynthesis C-methylase UbiE